ncbi:MAG: RTX toxin, partial [Betaproteobacteria bacterium HGW-Betaproteobacteria-16]
MAGGLGNDTYQVDNGADIVTELAGEGTDTVYSSLSYNLGENLENLTLTDSALSATGNELNNILLGNSGDNILDGGLGNDTLNGGEGADTMLGGLGDDIYHVDNSGDVVTELAGEGTDTVSSSFDYTLGANLENLILTGSALNATGNELDNTLTGNSGDNVLDGGTGADTMVGGAGDD